MLSHKGNPDCERMRWHTASGAETTVLSIKDYDGGWHNFADVGIFTYSPPRNYELSLRLPFRALLRRKVKEYKKFEEKYKVNGVFLSYSMTFLMKEAEYWATKFFRAINKS